MSGRSKGPSPRLMIVLLVLGIGLLIFGEYYYASGRRVYGVAGSALPTLIGLAVLAIDGVLVAIWRVFRDRPSALEDALREDDQDA